MAAVLHRKCLKNVPDGTTVNHSIRNTQDNGWSAAQSASGLLTRDVLHTSSVMSPEASIRKAV